MLVKYNFKQIKGYRYDLKRMNFCFKTPDSIAIKSLRLCSYSNIIEIKSLVIEYTYKLIKKIYPSPQNIDVNTRRQQSQIKTTKF